MREVILAAFLMLGCVHERTSFPPNGVAERGITVIEYGADWCPGCVEADITIKKLQKEYGFKLIGIDSDDDLAPAYINYRKHIKTMYIPTVSIFYNGKLYFHGTYPSDEGFESIIGDLQ